MVLPLQEKIIYGPIKSRRLGISLGINILSPFRKICSFDCVYCHYGGTNTLTLCPDPASLYSVTDILKATEQAIQVNPKIDHITFSGNGEPTIHPKFPEIALGIKTLRDKYLPGVRLAIFSNATTLSKDEIIIALDIFDSPILKLDTADEIMFQKINMPCDGIRLDEIIRNLKKIKNPTLQTLFLGGKISNAEGEVYQKWLGVIAEIHPARIQIYSTDRPVADIGSERILPSRLIQIVEEVRNKLNLSIEAYWAT